MLNEIYVLMTNWCSIIQAVVFVNKFFRSTFQWCCTVHVLYHVHFLHARGCIYSLGFYLRLLQ